MIVIEIKEKEYKMPSAWSEVNLDLFEKIIKQTTGLSQYKSETEFSLDLFSILTGAPREDLMLMTRKSFLDLTEQINWVFEEVVPTKRKHWVINGEEFMAVENLNTLSMGESISLEIMIKDSNEENILTNILPILIRRVKKIQRTNGKVKKEPASFDSNEYEELKELFKSKLTVPDVVELKSFF